MFLLYSRCPMSGKSGAFKSCQRGSILQCLRTSCTFRASKQLGLCQDYLCQSGFVQLGGLFFKISGIVLVTTTHALTNVVLRFIVRLADMRCDQTFFSISQMAKGVNVKEVHLIYQAVADAHGLLCVLLTQVVWPLLKFGAQRRPVAHRVRDAGVGGSNPLAPTIFSFSRLHTFTNTGLAFLSFF